MKTPGLPAACIVASMLFTQPATAAGQPGDVCTELNSSIDSSLKELSSLNAKGPVLDDASPAAEAIAEEEEVQLTQIQVNVGLLAANKCQLPAFPIDTRMYARAAGDCARALRTLSPDYSKVCNRQAWTRGTYLPGG